MKDSKSIRLTLPAEVDALDVCGAGCSHLRLIESLVPVHVDLSGDVIEVRGEALEVDLAAAVVSLMFDALRHNEIAGDEFIRRSVRLLREGDFAPAALRSEILLTPRGKSIRPKTSGQKRYVEAIASHPITFATGCAGTGKTYLAMACALAAFKKKEFARIILTRPVVEAGENLGYLPGGLQEKVDPYIRPLYDALFEMEEPARAQRLLDEGAIEIAPLAYMRGRTLNDSFVILDEAQNTTPEQMKMFLTRLGFNSKMVVTGDASQHDLARRKSGLVDAQELLGGLDQVAFCEMGPKDVVRHSLVAEIIEAYDARDARELTSRDSRNHGRDHDRIHGHDHDSRTPANEKSDEREGGSRRRGAHEERNAR